VRIIATLVKLAREASVRDETFTSAALLRGTLDIYPVATPSPRQDAERLSAERRVRIAVDKPECRADQRDRLYATQRIVRRLW